MRDVRSSVPAECLLVVAGALDAGSLPAFTAQVDQLMGTPCRSVHLDLAGVTALDRVGTQAVFGLHSYVDARGGEMSITWPTTVRP